MQGHEVYNVDLCLDVLVEPDGVTFALIDKDDFAEAQAEGWLTAADLSGAKRGVGDLTAIFRTSGLMPFLERILSFDSVLDNVPQGPPRTLTVEDVPQFQLDERLRLWPDLDAQNQAR